MRTPPLILVVDDNPANVDILQARLAAQGYHILTASDGEEALATAREKQPDLILLDIMMPKMDGLEVCRRLKGDATLPFMPIILVTAKADSGDIVAGLEAGGDEYLTKPVDQAALVARVKSMLRIKALHDTVQEQAGQLAEWNRTLEQRVTEQLAQIERVSRLKRFLSPHFADLIISSGDEKLLESHRREITVVFCDLRGFTAFSESAEPEEVMGVLHDYHNAIGELIIRYEGTLDQFAGDGVMIFFNDPLPCADPAACAVRMAIDMRERVGDLAQIWRKSGYELGLGVGIAQGYATMGTIGFEGGRRDYGAIGMVTNLASRLCDEAPPWQILISQRVYAAVEELVEAEPIGDLALKGFSRPVAAYNVARLKEPSGSQARRKS
ncbi:MAG: adenylate/guanylate cyclase domain-containing protein [bacterium]